MRLLVTITSLVACAAAALAQDLGHKAPPQKAPIAIVGATVHTISGRTIENGLVVFDHGRLEFVGAASSRDQTPRGARVIDLTGRGLHVYPGLFGANTTTGLVEIGAVRATRDFSEVGGVSPEVRAAVAVNPDSAIIPVTRASGVLTVGVFPQSGAIPGRASVMRLDGWTWEDMAVAADAGLVVNWPNLRPITAWWMDKSVEDQKKEADEALRNIEDAFTAARAYLAARDADPSIPTDVRWEAMAPALRGDTPVLVSAQELSQIESAVAWARKHDLRAVIVGGRDADKCADLLTRNDVPVILTGVHRLPSRRDAAYDEPFTLPARLEELGVNWCLASGGGSFSTPNERNLPYHAATAVAYGLDHDVALEAITLRPARILGLGDDLGSLEAGKAATLFVSDGDPLEISAKLLMAFIDGREIDLRSKHTALDEKYREKYRQIDAPPND